MRRKVISFLLSLVLLAGLAQDSERRIISIDSSGGTQSGNLRFGPIQYRHPNPEGIVATVSTLTIYAQAAELRGPEGEQITLTDARGRRFATFTEGVRVTRGRLDATGPELFYSEADGLGTLSGSINIVVAPQEADEAPVLIWADATEFDVDNDVSISRGNVQLENGRQRAEADELLFEEERNLARLVREGTQVTAVRVDDEGSELIITADEIRVLTDEDKLFARGSVTIIDGDITSQGDVVFFDDTTSRAEVIGNPATSIDRANDVEVSGARLEQLIDLSIVRVLDATVPPLANEADFELSSER
jgi:lipopolysaccharide export system protein LptA